MNKFGHDHQSPILNNRTTGRARDFEKLAGTGHPSRCRSNGRAREVRATMPPRTTRQRSDARPVRGELAERVRDDADVPPD
jgi:hypothetical protein